MVDREGTRGEEGGSIRLDVVGDKLIMKEGKKGLS